MIELNVHKACDARFAQLESTMAWVMETNHAQAIVVAAVNNVLEGRSYDGHSGTEYLQWAIKRMHQQLGDE